MKQMVLICTLLLSALTGWAQNYSMDWFTIDGGAHQHGRTLFGEWHHRQHDAGTMSGGGYCLAGAFGASLTPSDARRSAARNPTTARLVRVYWPNPSTGFVLDSKPQRHGGWVASKLSVQHRMGATSALQ